MTTFFLDPEGGNDANDGLTFATRWKTIQGGATSARVAAGDTIRLIASPDPVVIGDATWTDNSGDITWAAPVNTIVDDCEVAWTAATSINTSTNTSRRKNGSTGASFTPLSAFTTGKIAHRTLPATLDLSAYQQISLWIWGGSAALSAAGALTLRLCSDTSGNTPIVSLPFPAVNAGAWTVVVLDAGGPLPNNVASLSLVAGVDPGTTTFYLDNIVACKAPGDPQCVTHMHAIGKNTGTEPEWYSVLALTDSGAVIGGMRWAEVGSSGNAPRPYRGTTETVPTSVLLGHTSGLAATECTIQNSGVENSPVTFSGGWNRTDMSVQDGTTYWNGRHYYAHALDAANRAWLTFEGMGGINFTGGLLNNTGTSDIVANFAQIVGCGGPWLVNLTMGGIQKLSFDYAQGMQTITPFNAAPSSLGFEMRAKRIHGSAVALAAAALSLTDDIPYYIDRIDNSGGYGVIMNASVENQHAYLYGTEFADNAGAADMRVQIGSIHAFDCIFSEGTAFAAAGEEGSIFSARDQRVANRHKTYNRYYNLVTDDTVRHTESGVSWRLSVLSSTVYHSSKPARFPLAKIAVRANQTCTVGCWLRRDNVALSLGLRLRGRQIPGVPQDVRALMTAAADTWEHVAINFIPSVDGVVEIEGIGWGGAVYNGWFDDLTVI